VPRECYAGVAETSVYVADGYRDRGVGKALLHKQVMEADDVSGHRVHRTPLNRELKIRLTRV
jgi:L-amino acid N-acyltransferase YncA